MNTAILAVHILVALAIIGLVLIQHGKGADAGAAFGAGAAGGVSGSVFGAKGATNFLSRSTAILATIFFLTSLAMAYISRTTEVPTSLMDQGTTAPVTKSAPAPVTDAPVVPEPATGGGTGSSDAPKSP